MRISGTEPSQWSLAKQSNFKTWKQNRYFLDFAFKFWNYLVQPFEEHSPEK